MATRIYWCELPEAAGGLAIVIKPRPVPYLDEDVGLWRSGGLDAVVSLLEADEAAQTGLSSQAAAMSAAGLDFVHYPVPDRGLPQDMASYDEVVSILAARIAGGQRIGFHCFASLGRSPTLAAGVLVRLGLSADEAISRLQRARQVTVPETPGQIAWIKSYAERIALPRAAK